MAGSTGPLGLTLGNALVLCVFIAAVVGLVNDPQDRAEPAPVQAPASAEPTPPHATASSAPSAPARTVTLRADPHGHFWIDGQVDGAPVRFIIDTGATGIALGPNVARAAGHRLVSADYTMRSKTANGVARAAPVTIRRLRVGPIRLNNMPAHVMERSMQGIALLGMSFLRRLDSYEVRGDHMFLRW